MTRALTPAVETDVEGDFNWVLLLQMNLDSGTVYIHTGVGDLPWNGFTWKGVGNMASISGIVETVDGGDDRINVMLSGIPSETFPDFVDEFTLEDTAGRDWFFFIAMLNEDGTVKGDASTLNSGTTGAAELVDGDALAIKLSLITEAALMKSVLFFRMTNEDQQKLFAGDLFFEFMGDLPREVRWGSADPVTLATGRLDNIEIKRHVR